MNRIKTFYVVDFEKCLLTGALLFVSLPGFKLHYLVVCKSVKSNVVK